MAVVAKIQLSRDGLSLLISTSRFTIHGAVAVLHVVAGMLVRGNPGVSIAMQGLILLRQVDAVISLGHVVAVTLGKGAGSQDNPDLTDALAETQLVKASSQSWMMALLASYPS